VGAGAEASVTTDIVSFTRSKGLYGGINVDGSVMKVDDSANENYFKKKVTPADILVRKTVRNPQADRLLGTVAAAAK
jgi:lipid-binding SYLF domain-containing protein